MSRLGPTPAKTAAQPELSASPFERPEPVSPHSRVSSCVQRLLEVRARPWLLVGYLSLIVLPILAAGCVSKATAEARARSAFLSGQQQALERMQQNQARGPSVTFLGEVKNNLIPWTADLTLARAIVAAEYYGRIDPKEIVVLRDNHEMSIDPKQLLSGGDIPLQPQDVIELRH